jgi:hypothetical protein
VRQAAYGGFDPAAEAVTGCQPKSDTKRLSWISFVSSTAAPNEEPGSLARRRSSPAGFCRPH